MTLGDIIACFEQVSADVLGCTVETLPPEERFHEHWHEHMFAMPATLAWFEVPHVITVDGYGKCEVGEILLADPAHAFRYGIMDSPYIDRVRARLKEHQP